MVENHDIEESPRKSTPTSITSPPIHTISHIANCSSPNPNSVSPMDPLNNHSNCSCGNSQGRISSPGWWTSTRFRISLLMMGGIAITGAIRFNLSVAMVCMVNSTAIHQITTDGNNNSNTIHSTSQSSTTEGPSGGCSQQGQQHVAGNYDGSFDWDSERQGLIFSAIWWGGVLTTFSGGFVADRYGPKNTAALCGLILIVTNALIPSMARLGYQYVLLIRFLMGLGQGIMVPTMGSLVSRWIPPAERSLTVATMSAGFQICVIFGNPLFAWLCTQKELLGGWPAIFYLSSIIGLVWWTMFMLYTSNRPAKHRSIDQRELQYIEHNLRNEHLSGRRKAATVPWRAMAQSSVLWAYMIQTGSGAFVNFTMATYIPTYFKEVLYFDINKNGLLSALPFIMQLISTYIWTFFSRQLHKRTRLSQTTICTVFNSIGGFGQASFLLAVSFLDCRNSAMAVVCLCGSSLMAGSFIPGYLTAALFIAPIYSGLVMACGSTVAQIGGILSPYIVGSVTKNSSKAEWQIVFMITVANLCVSSIVWILFGSSEIQPWALTKKLDVDEEASEKKSQNNNGFEFIGKY